METKDKTKTIAAGKVVAMRFKDQEGKQNNVIALLLSPIVYVDGFYKGSVLVGFATDIDTGNRADKYPDKDKNWKLNEIKDRKIIAWFYEQVVSRCHKSDKTNSQLRPIPIKKRQRIINAD